MNDRRRVNCAIGGSREGRYRAKAAIGLLFKQARVTTLGLALYTQEC